MRHLSTVFLAATLLLGGTCVHADAALLKRKEVIQFMDQMAQDHHFDRKQ